MISAPVIANIQAHYKELIDELGLDRAKHPPVDSVDQVRVLPRGTQVILYGPIQRRRDWSAIQDAIADQELRIIRIFID